MTTQESWGPAGDRVLAFPFWRWKGEGNVQEAVIDARLDGPGALNRVPIHGIRLQGSPSANKRALSVVTI